MMACWKLGLSVVLALVAGAASPARHTPSPALGTPVPEHLADAGDAVAVASGEKLYLAYCASCHGRYRQGQPLWQLIDAYAGRRAPALDDTGNIWRRSDEAIFHMVKYGRYASAAPDGASYMPVFRNVLGDHEILAILAFVKARWPIGLRIAQAMLNPGLAGMPVGVGDPGWRLPPGCNAMFRRNDAVRYGRIDPKRILQTR
jgi:mono/diheme cytochrome c family protein